MIKKYNITVNGNTYEVEVEELGSEVQNQRPKATQQSPQPKPQVAQKPKQNNQGLNNSGGNVCAPMPGTINDVRVKTGDSVKKGQVLLILEAMKMENEIVAPTDGTVISVDIEKGQNVNLGDSLVQIG